MDLPPDTHDRSTPSVLLVEDDERFRERLGRALTARGCEVRAVASVKEALAAAAQESPELAVVDLKLPVGSGLDVVRGLHAIDPTTRIVVLTGYGSIATALESMKLGATHYLTKPQRYARNVWILVSSAHFGRILLCFCWATLAHNRLSQ